MYNGKRRILTRGESVLKKNKILTFSILLCLVGGLTWHSFLEKNDTIEKEEVVSTTEKKDNAPIEGVETIEPLTPSLIAQNGKIVEKRENKDLPVEDVEEGSPMEKIIKLQQEIESLEESKDDIQDKIFILNNEISTYKGEIRKNDSVIDSKKESLKNNLLWLFKSKENEILMSSIFNSTNIKDFIVSYNNAEKFIEKTNKNISGLMDDNMALDYNRFDVVNQKALLTSLMKDATNKESLLIEKHNELVSLLKSEELALAKQSLASTNSIRVRKSNYMFKGQRNSGMIAPCQGTITSDWGDRVHPIYGTVKHHAGLDIGVDYGTPIVASSNGVVTLASWYGGYGKAVMIDHGGDIKTLYGHNSKILVKEGEIVKQGQVIALAGSTGNSTGPHCHFEVILNGQDVNPLSYIN